jgi:hypothetical protein
MSLSAQLQGITLSLSCANHSIFLTRTTCLYNRLVGLDTAGNLYLPTDTFVAHNITGRLGYLQILTGNRNDDFPFVRVRFSHRLLNFLTKSKAVGALDIGGTSLLPQRYSMLG